MTHHPSGKIVTLRRYLTPRSATDGVRDGAEGNQRGIPLRTVEGVQLAEGRAGIKGWPRSRFLERTAALSKRIAASARV